MTKLKEGIVNPLTNKAAEAELRFSDDHTDFFDVLCAAKIPSPAYPKAWKTDTLKYGAYVEANIPFLLVELPNESRTYALPVNVYAGAKATWVNDTGNVVNVFLVNADSGLIAAQRTFGADSRVVSQIKAAAKAQQTQYKTAAEVQAAIGKIVAAKNPKLMLAATQMITLMQV
jgi:hypothetical protein